MGLSKAILFSDEQNRLAILARVFAHPARIAIIEYLFKHQTCVVNTLLDELPLSQSTISQHLKEMKNAGMTTRDHVFTSSIDMQKHAPSPILGLRSWCSFVIPKVTVIPNSPSRDDLGSIVLTCAGPARALHSMY